MGGADPHGQVLAGEKCAGQALFPIAVAAQLVGAPLAQVAAGQTSGQLVASRREVLDDFLVLAAQPIGDEHQQSLVLAGQGQRIE